MFSPPALASYVLILFLETLRDQVVAHPNFSETLEILEEVVAEKCKDYLREYFENEDEDGMEIERMEYEERLLKSARKLFSVLGVISKGEFLNSIIFRFIWTFWNNFSEFISEIILVDLKFFFVFF